MSTEVLINKANLTLEADGIISRKKVKATLIRNDNQGLRFILASGTVVPARIDNLFSTQRNTVIAQNEECVCLCEHFLAACALVDLNNIDIYLNENELPFADGSAMCWLDLFRENTPISTKVPITRILTKPILIADESDSSRYIELIPSESFRVTYQLDWRHPLIGIQEYTWNSETDSVELIGKARTFSNEAENQILGLSGWVIGLTDDSFTHELHFPDEPARHKALDLVGDMMLSGINPLSIGMHVISHKGGHELNSKVARYLADLYES
jgi:UDP-3-O-[3-hydroxymyristoyl] N-acetylglucosamine deacetylase